MRGTLKTFNRLSVMSDQRGGTVWGLRRPALWLAGLLVIGLAGSASPQGNIDAGKTPAQMFADTCSNCHRRPQELKRASVGFLRQHYTPGAQEAAAMASYLAGVPAAVDPRAGKERPKGLGETKGPVEKEKAKAPTPPPQQQVQDRPQERPKTQQAPKPKRAAEVAKSTVGEVQAETPQESVHEAPPAVPKLEPFEE
jgi:outer membrane biosynthesis protein TonB